MKEGIVVDTNVLVTANGRDTHADIRCRIACIEELERIRNSCQLLLDNRRLIFDEYSKKSNRSGQPGDGDSFLKWVWDNLWLDQKIRQVVVTPHGDRGFVEFPTDSRLKDFDRDDRKFVAVAVSSNSSPKVVNATDSRSWWHYREELHDIGIDVSFTCPELMTRPSNT